MCYPLPPLLLPPGMVRAYGITYSSAKMLYRVSMPSRCYCREVVKGGVNGFAACMNLLRYWQIELMNERDKYGILAPAATRNFARRWGVRVGHKDTDHGSTVRRLPAEMIVLPEREWDKSV